MPSFFGMPFNKLFSTEDVFTDALRKSALTENPTIIPDIDLVYVLSGRSTVLGSDADKLPREIDTADDLERLLEGIRIATQVNALRAGKEPEQLKPEEWVTPILYNGRPIHNEDLKTALKKGLIPYPEKLFIIRDIKPENTIGQIQSFKKYLLSYQHKNIAVVTSAYHIPRVARTIGNESPQTYSDEMNEHPIKELNLFLFGVHKQEKRRGMIEDIRGEHRAMTRYSQGDEPSIAQHQSENTFFNDVDLTIAKSFSRAKFWHRVAVPPVLDSCPFSSRNTTLTGVLRLLKRPEHIELDAARSVLVESFIGEYQKYLFPSDIDQKLTSWRGGNGSVAHYYEEYFRTELGEFLSGKLDYWVEARVCGKLVGWATFEREKSKPNAVYMNLLIVHPEHQGQAIGSNLVMSLCKLGVIPDLSTIHLLLRKKNKGGREFYSKLGFSSDPIYQREDNFVDLDLLEALTWRNPALQHLEQQTAAAGSEPSCSFTM